MKKILFLLSIIATSFLCVAQIQPKGGITGTGTASTITMFTGSKTAGNSRITQETNYHNFGRNIRLGGLATATTIPAMYMDATPTVSNYILAKNSGVSYLNGTEVALSTDGTVQGFIKPTGFEFNNNVGIGLSASPSHAFDLKGGTSRQVYTMDGEASGTSNITYSNSVGGNRISFYGQSGATTIQDFFTNGTKNSSIQEGTGYFSISNKYRFSVKNFATNDSKLFVDMSTGYTGIGSAYFIPSAQLNVDGKVVIGSQSNLGGYAKLEIPAGTDQGIYGTSTGSIFLNANETTGAAVKGGVSTGIALQGVISNSSGTALKLDDSAGSILLLKVSSNGLKSIINCVNMPTSSAGLSAGDFFKTTNGDGTSTIKMLD